jgi:hypothetical protein
LVFFVKYKSVLKKGKVGNIMKKMKLFKKVTVLTALVLTLSGLSSISSLADSSDSIVDSELTSVKFNTTVNSEVLTEAEKEAIVKENPLSEKVLSDEFDLEESVENIPSLQEMNDEEENLFYSIIDEQVALANISDPEEREIYKDSLVNFFNKESESFNNLEGLQNELEESIIQHLENEKETSAELISFLENASVSTFGVTSAKAISNPFKGKVRISVKAAGAVFNTVIGIAVGGGVGAIQAFIVKKGKDAAQKLFTRTVVSRLKAWGAPKLALVVGVSVTTALNYLDIGTNIAKQIDKRDSKKNSGYIEIY